MFMLADMKVRDLAALRRYATEVQPLMARHGGAILTISTSPPQAVEGDWRSDVVVIQRWRSAADFEEFWDSADYQPLKQLRHAACETRIVRFEGLPPAALGLG